MQTEKELIKELLDNGCIVSMAEGRRIVRNPKVLERLMKRMAQQNATDLQEDQNQDE